MPKAAAGTAKAFSNAQKAKGLTKLRFYCQVCEKPCRDENGYKCHIETEGHMRRLQAMTGEKGQLVGKVVDDFSKQFQDGFVSLLSRRFGSRRIKANQVYQEYIADRHHLHMNATRWLSLSEFAKHLGREGIARVEEDENVPGTWYLTWIDNSPEALKRQDALRKMERAKLDDESRQKRFLAEQIRKAKEAAEQKEGGKGSTSSASTSAGEEGQAAAAAAAPGELKRDETAQPLKIGFAAKLRPPPSSEAGPSSTASASNDTSSTSSAAAASSAPTASAGAGAGAGAAPIAGGGFKLGFNPLKSASSASTSSSAAPSRPPMGFNALKAANKPPSSAAAAPPGSSGSAPKRMTAEERIMMEEMERKRRIGSGAGPGAGAGAGAGGNKRIRL